MQVFVPLIVGSIAATVLLVIMIREDWRKNKELKRRKHDREQRYKEQSG